MIESDFLHNTDDIIEKMRGIPTLMTFDDADLHGLLQMSKIRKYRSGEQIIREASYDSWIYYLLSGKVKISSQGKVLGHLEKTGDLFGEMGIINDSARSASVYAVGETVCLATDISYHDRLSGHDKVAFGYLLYRLFAEILSNRLRETNEKFIAAKKEVQRLKSLLKT